jgi:RNA polymerase sigma-70 factor, ECF subfamily
VGARPYVMHMPRDPADIVRRARAGAPEAIEEFVRANWSPVWRAAYAVTADAQLAEDAAQEAFVRALRSLHRLHGRPLRPWLRRIAVNAAIDQLRRRPRRWVGAELAPDVSPSAAVVPDGDLMTAVLGLSDERRTVVVMHYWLDWTQREIAAALDIPPGTVASRLSRALDELALRMTEVRSGNAH